MDSLNTAELHLCRLAAQAAGILDVAFDERATIRAEVLQRFIFGIDLPCDDARSEPFSRPNINGLRLTNATIDGRLDLSGAGDEGLKAGWLHFRDCLFGGGFSGAGSRFERLEFERCHFGCPDIPDDKPDPAQPGTPRARTAAIDLANARISGDLEFTDPAPAIAADPAHKPPDDGEDPRWRLDFYAMTIEIGGSLIFTRGRWQAPPRRAIEPWNEPECSAINLTMARIGGALWAGPEFKAFGLVRLRNLEVGGDLGFVGAQLMAQPRPAAPPGSEYDNVAALDLQSARISGHLWLAGGSNQRDDKGISGDLHLVGVKVAGTVAFEDVFQASGMVNMASAVITRNLHFSWNRLAITLLGQLNLVDLTCGKDCIIAASVHEKVDLRDSDIKGNLTLSELTFRGTPTPVLDLSGVNVGGELSVVQDRYLPSRLLQARKVALRCLPGWELVETLWQMKSGVNAQVGFLRKGDELIRLDGRSDLFHRLIARQAHGVTDEAAAREYLRLFCAYILGDRGDFRIITSAGDLESHYRIDLERTAANHSDRTDPSAPSPVDLPETITSFSDIAPSCFDVVSIKSDDDPFDYKFRLIIVYHDILFFADIGMRVAAGGIEFEMTEDYATGIYLALFPAYRKKLAFVWTNRGAPGAGELGEAGPGFVTPPTLPGMEVILPHKVDEIEDIERRAHLSSTLIDQGLARLDHAHCRMLADDAGRAWGPDARVSMNMLTYERTDWSHQATGQQPGLADRLVRTGRAMLHFIVPGWILPRPRVDWPAPAYSPDPWKSRLRWLYQHYPSAPINGGDGQPYPDLKRETWQPQPFEQIIKVSHAEGQDEYATGFAIEKRRIEWALTSEAIRERMALAALIAAMIVLAWAWQEARPASWSDLLSGAAIAAAAYAATRLPLARTQFADLKRNRIHVMMAEASAQVETHKLDLQSRQGLEPREALRRSYHISHHFGRVRRKLSGLQWRAFVSALARGPDALSVVVVIGAVWLLARPDAAASWVLGWAGIIFLGVLYLSDIASLLLRVGFGYLMRPLNALVTLVVVFLAGWLGVWAANDARMLVIDITPVATRVVEERTTTSEGQQVALTVGGERYVGDKASVASDLHCGSAISEPLYALDVLIPLIDLRQEGRCEVGVARLPSQPSDAKTAQWRSVAGWSIAKAVYAILGWIVVSLSILTFAYAFRTHKES